MECELFLDFKTNSSSVTISVFNNLRVTYAKARFYIDRYLKEIVRVSSLFPFLLSKYFESGKDTVILLSFTRFN